MCIISISISYLLRITTGWDEHNELTTYMGPQWTPWGHFQADSLGCSHNIMAGWLKERSINSHGDWELHETISPWLFYLRGTIWSQYVSDCRCLVAAHVIHQPKCVNPSRHYRSIRCSSRGYCCGSWRVYSLSPCHLSSNYLEVGKTRDVGQFQIVANLQIPTCRGLTQRNPWCSINH